MPSGTATRETCSQQGSSPRQGKLRLRVPVRPYMPPSLRITATATLHEEKPALATVLFHEETCPTATKRLGHQLQLFHGEQQPQPSLTTSLTPEEAPHDSVQPRPSSLTTKCNMLSLRVCAAAGIARPSFARTAASASNTSGGGALYPPAANSCPDAHHVAPYRTGRSSFQIATATPQCRQQW